jgi:hypothetical protein
MKSKLDKQDKESAQAFDSVNKKFTDLIAKNEKIAKIEDEFN